MRKLILNDYGFYNFKLDSIKKLYVNKNPGSHKSQYIEIKFKIIDADLILTLEDVLGENEKSLRSVIDSNNFFVELKKPELTFVNIKNRNCQNNKCMPHFTIQEFLLD